MRNVLFKEWVPQKLDNGKIVKGTNCWSSEYTGRGVFHQWGSSYEEFESGPGNYTTAIVELTDGSIVEVLPRYLKFIDGRDL